MRRLNIILAAVGGFSLSLGGGTAVAGSCGYNAPAPSCGPQYAPPVYAPPLHVAPPPPVYTAPPLVYKPAPPVYRPLPIPRPMPPKPCHKGHSGHGCDPQVISYPGAPTTIDPVIVTTSQPLDHLRSVRFHGSPHINITRLYGQGQVAGLTDAPRAFTGGCHPGSTHYGNANAHQYCGQKSTAVKAATQPVPQPIKIAAPAPVPAPAPVQVQAPVIVQAPTPPAPQPLSIAPPPPISDYWQKTSGPTMVDGMDATQVFCRRPAPIPAPRPIPRPIIGVPVPVPTPIYSSCYNPPSRYKTEPVMAGGPRHSRGSRYGSAH